MFGLNISGRTDRVEPIGRRYASQTRFLYARGFRKLSGNFKKPIVIYFNEKQLAKLNASARPKTGKPPGKSLSLTVSQVDGILGGFVTAKCPETPTKIGSGEFCRGSA